MRETIKKNHQRIKDLFSTIEATNGRGSKILFEEATENAITLIQEKTQSKGKLIFIGNGGSAAIASHMAMDFWKNAGIKATAFNDSAALTCISNDDGYKYVFEKPLEVFGERNDILIAISSSGKSENILRAVQKAKEKNIAIITFSGFKSDNPLRKLGELNFYVPTSHYGHVECLHHFIIHSFIDIMNIKQPKLTERAVSYE